MTSALALQATWLQMVSERCIAHTGWNESGTTAVADEISLGSHLPFSPSPKQILTVSEGAASSRSLMSCVLVTAVAVRLQPQHLYGPEAAPQDMRWTSL